MTDFNEVCDQCGAARAHYHISKETQSMFMCGSHTRQNSEALLLKGFTITPETYKEYGEELDSVKNTPEVFVENQEELREIVKEKIKMRFTENPDDVIMNIFIPEAQKITGYTEPIKVSFRREGNKISVRFLPYKSELSEDEALRFADFTAIVSSIMGSVLN